VAAVVCSRQAHPRRWSILVILSKGLLYLFLWRIVSSDIYVNLNDPIRSTHFGIQPRSPEYYYYFLWHLPARASSDCEKISYSLQVTQSIGQLRRLWSLCSHRILKLYAAFILTEGCPSLSLVCCQVQTTRAATIEHITVLYIITAENLSDS